MTGGEGPSKNNNSPNKGGDGGVGVGQSPHPNRRFSIVDIPDEYDQERDDLLKKSVSPGYTFSHTLDKGMSPQNVRASFNVDIDDTGDDILLDWEQYSRGARTFTLFGKEFRLTPPEWWFHRTKAQRRALLAAGLCVGFTSVFFVLVMVFTSLRYTVFGNGTSVPHPENACEWVDWRLPRWVKPTSYDLNFGVDMKDPWDVNGEVVIHVDVVHATRCIVLHAQNMTIADARLVNGGFEDREYVKNNGVAVVDKRHNASLEQLTLEWQDVIPTGKNTMYLTFTYPLREGLSGFYKSSYMDGESKEYLAVTQFEANAARLAFPCFDEPEYKTEFTVEVITSKDYQVLSNMPPKTVHHHDTQEEDVKTWHFETTPPMSTYLLAIVIGKLASVRREIDVPVEGVWKSDEYYRSDLISASNNKRVVQVWGVPSQIKSLEYAANVAAAIVPFYEGALQVAYALPKLDLVAIPDFSAGAMENWGLITYRETALMISPTSSLDDTRYVTLVVAHELAHQWFGNLVTMTWWNDLWLNEGFASYVEYLGSESAHPELSYLEDFYIENQPKALEFDGKNVSHSLSMPMENVMSSSSIEGVFDAIEYQKGGSVLRMLRSWMNRDASIELDGWEMATANQVPTTDPFLKGLHEYLIKYSYKNSSASALWESIGTSSDIDLIPLMNEWTFKDGYPLVTVSVDGKGNVKLQQQRFSASEEIPCDTDNVWWIPTAFISSDSATQVKWGELNSCQSIRPLATIGKTGWIKVNARQYGYYRVNYSPQLWGQLHNAVQQYDANGYPVIGGVDAAGLIEDSFHVAGHSDVHMDVFLTFVKNLGGRPVDDAAPWMSALPYLKRIDHLISCEKKWSSFVSSEILGPFIQNGTLSGNMKANLVDFFTFNGPEEIDGAAKPRELEMLRPAILDAAGYYGISTTVKEAERIFADISTGKDVTLHPNLRSSVYNAVAKTNNKKTMGLLIQMLESAENADESQRIMKALALFDQGDSVLNLALAPAIKSQDVGILIESIASSGGDKAAVRAMQWMQKNIRQLFEKLGGDTVAGRKIGQMIERSAAHIKDTSAIRIFSSIQESNLDVLDDQKYIGRAIESVNSNTKWVELHDKFICDWIGAKH